MKLILSDDQKMLLETAQKIVRDHPGTTRLRTYRDDRDLPGYSPELWQQLAGLGFLGLNIPEAHGGSDLGFVELCLLMEAAGSVLLPEPLLSTVVLGTQALLLSGDEGHQATLLPDIAGGSRIVAFAHLEPGSRNNRFHSATRAEPSGDGFRLNGRKHHIFDGHLADDLLLVARTSGEVDDAAGLTCFRIPAGQPGVTIARLHQIDERNTALVDLRDVQVTSEHLVGKQDHCGDWLDGLLDRATIAFAAEMLGAAERAFDITLDYLKQRVQFDVPIGSFQALQHRAANMFIQLQLSRSAVLGAANAVDEGSPRMAELASLAKAKLSDTMVLVANEGVQMHGGVGVTDEYDIGYYLKRARAADATFGDAGWHKTRWARLRGY